MSFMGKGLFRWDRRERTGATSDLGRPVTASAAGFPRNVAGNYQENTRRATIVAQGAKIVYAGTLYSDAFTGGRVGDLVTVNGQELWVAEVGKRSGFQTSNDKFGKYVLTSEEPGAGQV